MDLPARQSEAEQERIADLFRLVPAHGERVLDAGARDGFLSKLLSARFEAVVALDLTKPDLDHPGITSVAGDITQIDYPDQSFDLVMCAEVLEHIPPHLLEKACSELMRVSARAVVIGVPYRQDLRAGRTTCRNCGHNNPPWGHVNSFDEARLNRLFNGFTRAQLSYCGLHHARTNTVSAALLNLAGNPYGTYHQMETCIHCNAELVAPTDRSIVNKLMTRGALYLQALQYRLSAPTPKWIHALYQRA